MSTWRYDERGALGTLSGFAGNGSETDYYYNASGLSEEVSVKVKGEVFSTFYYYDDFERVTREVRPNGAATTLADAAKQLSSANKKDSLAVEYVYNPYGYQLRCAARKPTPMKSLPAVSSVMILPSYLMQLSSKQRNI